jgi:branched-chain amino acid transport system permease protein
MREALVVLGVGLAALGATPWLRAETLRVIADVAMVAALALGWNFIGGITGYPSFATAGFFGLGAYTVGFVMLNSAPFAVALGAAALAGGLCAALLGLGVLRLKGHYFAIATFGVAEALKELVTNLEFVGGGTGLNLPVFRGGPREFSVFFYVAMVLVAMTAAAVTLLLVQRPVGYGLRAIRDNEDAASCRGVNTRALKSLAFTLSGIFAAVPGGIYAYRSAYIEPADVFDVLFSIKPIIAAVVGGAGTVLGPVLGAVGFEAFRDLMWGRFLEFHNMFLGVAVVLVVIFAPQGAVTLLRQLRGLRRARDVGDLLGASVRQHRI